MKMQTFVHWELSLGYCLLKQKLLQNLYMLLMGAVDLLAVESLGWLRFDPNGTLHKIKQWFINKHLLLKYRYNWSCSPWKVDSSQSYIWSSYCQI